MKMSRASRRHPARRKKIESPRVTIRVHENTKERLNKMGVIERGHFAKFYRDRLAQFLDEWTAAHPATNGKTLTLAK